jgi:hypothetical protein
MNRRSAAFVDSSVALVKEGVKFIIQCRLRPAWSSLSRDALGSCAGSERLCVLRERLCVLVHEACSKLCYWQLLCGWTSSSLVS